MVLDLDQVDAIPAVSVDVKRAARAIGLGERTVRELLRTGELASFHVGARRLIPVDELKRFVSERMTVRP